MTATPPESPHSDDLYARLGVTHEADALTIRRAYQQLVKRYPPERAPEEFKRIREAYETLSSPETRAEYDRSARSPLERLLRGAQEAMQQEDYATAERLYKQALLEQPDLRFARNFLGLCFLYQRKSGEAIAQFTRLLAMPDADPVWFANAGHAYRMAGRVQDAERAFQEAVRRSPDGGGEHYIGWASLYMDRKEWGKARAVLERGINADGKVDFDDLPLVLKLLEVNLFERQDRAIDAALQRIQKIAQDEEQRRFAAWRLGGLAWQLVEVEAFQRAETVAAAAVRLQPEDIDYDALADVAHALDRFDHATALRLMRSHVSFAPNGYLHELGTFVRAYCERNRALAGMQKISGPPPLRTINTFGFRLYGARDADPVTQSHVSTLYFVALFVPLLPLACYRVIPQGADRWIFLGKVRFGRAQRWHLGIAIAAMALWLIMQIAPGVSSPPAGLAWSPAVSQELSQSTKSPSAFSAPPGEASQAAQPQAPVTVNATSVYKGQVTNAGVPEMPASLQLDFTQWSPQLEGYLSIGAPLGGSGPFRAAWNSDTLIVVSISPAGDTILWVGLRYNQSVSGVYQIVGGQYHHQHGTWSVHYSSGRPLSSESP